MQRRSLENESGVKYKVYNIGDAPSGFSELNEDIPF